MPQQNRPGPERHTTGDRDRGLLVIVLVIFTAAGTGIFSCGGFLVWQFLRPVDTPPAELQTAEEKRPSCRRRSQLWMLAFRQTNSVNLTVSSSVLRRPQAMMTTRGFQQLIHSERLHEEMHRSGLMPEQLRVFDLMLQDTLAEQLWLPVYATRHHIVHVTRISNSEDAVVYAHFWYGQDDPTEMRVWVTHDRGRWEIF